MVNGLKQTLNCELNKDSEFGMLASGIQSFCLQSVCLQLESICSIETPLENAN